MMKSARWAIAAVLSIAAFAGAGAKSSQGAVILVLQSTSPTGTGPYSYTYDSSLSASSQLQTGDYFAIIDFAGYVDGSVFSSNSQITASVQNTTLFPPNQIYADDPNTVNLLFTYTGTTPLTGSVSDLGDFGAQSSFGVISSLLFQTASDHKEVVQGSGNYSIPAGNTTRVQGPTAVAAVPEPATLGLALSAGLAGLAAYSRRVRKTA